MAGVKSKMLLSIFIMLGVLFMTPVFADLNASAPLLNTESWSDAEAFRETPDMSGVHLYKCRDAVKVSKENCERDLWKLFLRRHGLDELHAPSDGKAYRWLWGGGERYGFVQIAIDAKGDVWLNSSISGKGVFLKKKAISSFETDIAATNFATMIQNDHDGALDNCQDQLLEAIVGGRYHFVYGACGVPPPIQKAARRLEHLAGFKKPALDPDGCRYWLCDDGTPNAK